MRATDTILGALLFIVAVMALLFVATIARAGYVVWKCADSLTQVFDNFITHGD